MADQRKPNPEYTIDRAPHQQREQEQRTSEHPGDSFLPQSNLPTPKPQDGYLFRWIRTSMVGNTDNTNVSKRFREGWQPVKAVDHPELQIMTDHGSRFPENVEVGGLLLCKAPVELIQRRKEYFRKLAETQLESVDNNLMRESDPRMPLSRPERKTRVEFGRG